MLLLSLALHLLAFWGIRWAPPASGRTPERLLQVVLRAPAAVVRPRPAPKAATAPKTKVSPKPRVRPVRRVTVKTQPPHQEPRPIIKVAKALPTRTTPLVAKRVLKPVQKVETAPSSEHQAQPLKPIVKPKKASPLPNTRRADDGTGQGTGLGSGSGDGSGSGSGTGNGSGSGSGDGSGSGSGTGSGSGSGSGSGVGTGDGTGNGTGSGDGNGSGGGSGEGGNGGGDDNGGGGGGGGGGKGGPYGLGGRGAGEPPRHIVYVLDISLSMEPRIEAAKNEIRQALAGLQPDESFGIVAFYGKARRFKKQLLPATPANEAEANQFLDGLSLDEGTNLERALRRTFAIRGVNVVVLITDGVPTYGEQNFDALAAQVRQMNQTGARLFTIGLKGDNPDDPDPQNTQFEATRLLQQLARDSGGTCRIVDAE